jgi:hypothetical protein
MLRLRAVLVLWLGCGTGLLAGGVAGCSGVLPCLPSPLALAGVSRPMIRLVVVLMVWRAAVNISEVMP